LQSVYEQDLVALRILSHLENRTLETGAVAASLAIDTDHGTAAAARLAD